MSAAAPRARITLRGVAPVVVTPERRLPPLQTVSEDARWGRALSTQWSDSAPEPLPEEVHGSRVDESTSGAHVDEDIDQLSRRLVRAYAPAGRLQTMSVPVELRAAGRRGMWSIDAMAHAGFPVSEPDPSVAFVLITSDPLALFISPSDESIHWGLLPGGPGITARADALRFLRALSFGARLSLRSHGDGLNLTDFIATTPWKWEYEDEWRLFEDLAALEEWTGRVLPMPDEISPEQANDVAQAAQWVRTQRIEARLDGPIEFTARDEVDAADELRIHQPFSVTAVATQLDLGTGEARVPIQPPTRLGDVRSGVRYEAVPRDNEIAFVLTPPAGVVPSGRRTGVLMASSLEPSVHDVDFPRWLAERGGRAPTSSLAAAIAGLSGLTGAASDDPYAASRLLRAARPAIGR